jgi:tRNA pseudouridine55 synthase
MTSKSVLQKKRKSSGKAKFSGDGVLLLDKPSGPTSHDVVQVVKRRLGANKLGHGGTLDPLATGVLVLLVNGATKLSPFLVDQVKSYRFTVVFGVETDTQDSTGKVIERRACQELPEKDIGGACAKFVGKIEQRVPRYSAVRVRGRRLYRLARSGVEVVPPSRTVQILSLVLDELRWPEATFEVACSKGTYVRTLGVDLAHYLGCPGHVNRLRRLSSGGFHLEQTVSLEQLDEIMARDELERVMIPPGQALEGYPAIQISHVAANRLRQGGLLDYRELPDRGQGRFWPEGAHRVLDPDGNLVAMVCRSTEMLTPGQEQEIVFKTLRVFGTVPEDNPKFYSKGRSLRCEQEKVEAGGGNNGGTNC